MLQITACCDLTREQVCQLFEDFQHEFANLSLPCEGALLYNLGMQLQSWDHLRYKHLSGGHLWYGYHFSAAIISGPVQISSKPGGRSYVFETNASLILRLRLSEAI